MGHPVRLMIADALSYGELAVYEVAELCEISPPQACEHLRLMKRQGFLESERRGKSVYYRIKNSPLTLLMDFVNHQRPNGSGSGH